MAVIQSQASILKHNASVAMARYEALFVAEVNVILSLFFPVPPPHTHTHTLTLETHQLNHLNVIGKLIFKSYQSDRGRGSTVHNTTPTI